MRKRKKPTASKGSSTRESGHVEIQEFDMPTLGKGAAICKILMAGVCGTDKHTYSGETVQYKGTPDEFSIPFPIIQGHELAMEIVAIDEEGAQNLSFDGDYLKVGDRVTICPDVVCISEECMVSFINVFCVQYIVIADGLCRPRGDADKILDPIRLQEVPHVHL